MCLILTQQAGDKPFSGQYLKNGWSHNDDGAGYMFAHNGKLIIRKPFYRLKELQVAYAADHRQYGRMSAFAVHLRYSTHGSDEPINVHPHTLCDGKVGLVHNGILDGFGSVLFDDRLSDTAQFCQTALYGRQQSQVMSRRFLAWMASVIGAHNKMALMDNAGRVAIVNASAGITDGVRWYSNSNYATYARPRYVPLRPTLNDGPGLFHEDPDFLSEDEWKHDREHLAILAQWEQELERDFDRVLGKAD